MSSVAARLSSLATGASFTGATLTVTVAVLETRLSVVAGTFVTAQGGSIVIAADGSYTYTPPADFHGIDTVDYTVTDGSLTDTATLTLTVTPVPSATR
ncbi:cadherin-like domain-containing protein [Pseudomonas stutzeri]|nr:cadherin-like domain-containing protein [Stutzerimonas stutzeri]